MAKLYFEYGTMSSGKTIRLLQTAYNYEETGRKIYLIKPAIDTKAWDKIASRIGLERNVDFMVQKEQGIFSKINNLAKDSIDCILVDEAQFLEKNQIDELLQIVLKLKIPVICFGLKTDFRTEMFSGSKRLFEIAHSIKEIKTICVYCERKAIFNARMVNWQFVKTWDKIAIDMEKNVSYKPLCAKCYFENV